MVFPEGTPIAGLVSRLAGLGSRLADLPGASVLIVLASVAIGVVVANFVPRGNRAANAALWGFTRLNARLFDAAGGDALAQLSARTAASRGALADRMDTVETTRHVFGTIEINAGTRTA